MYVNEKMKHIPQGSFYIQASRPNKNGKLYLYIVIDEDNVKKVLSDFDKIEQDYIYMKDGKISLVPFIEEKVVDNNTEQPKQIKRKKNYKKKLDEEISD